MSISDVELSHALADPDPLLQKHAHQLLGTITLWLGICQWAAGQSAAASRSFARSAQLPNAPKPDPTLFPPDLITAYRQALETPRKTVNCKIAPGLSPHGLTIDGKVPASGTEEIQLTEGIHHLILKVPEATQLKRPGGGPREQTGGPDEGYSLRLDASAQRCRIQPLAQQPPERMSCINPQEARTPDFAAEVTQEAMVGGTLIISTAEKKVSIRYHRTGSHSFQHQLDSSPRGDESLRDVVSRGIDLLLGDPARPMSGTPSAPSSSELSARPWYKKGWVWMVTAGAVIAVVTSAVLLTDSDRVRIVFEPP
jgi:hypothetical protein